MKIYEVAIVGAGPIGIELAVALKDAGIDTIHLEARQIGYTMSWWPRNTYFFSTTERIEIAGVPAQVPDQRRMTGEEYLAYLRSIVEQFDLQIHTYEPVRLVQPNPEGFSIVTNPLAGERRYYSRRVVLATGDMHAPSMLNIPGEDLPHVSHYFEDPHKYFRTRLLIVGGRNSAVEAALRCWRVGAQVAISYRGAAFDEQLVKNWILPDLLAQIELGNIRFYPNTQPIEITPEYVVLQRVDDGRTTGRKTIIHPVDFVLLNTGFVADTRLMESAGVNLVGEQLAPSHDPETMETNVPGLFVAGTAIAGTQKRYRVFIENSHVHVGRIVKHITGDWPKRLGTIPSRQYDLPFEEIQAN